MIISQIVDLVNKLTEVTNKKEIKWERTSNPQEYITHAFQKNAICFSKVQQVEEEKYSLAVLDQTGHEIFRIVCDSSDGHAFLAFRSLFSCLMVNDDDNIRLFQELLKKLAENDK